MANMTDARLLPWLTTDRPFTKLLVSGLAVLNDSEAAGSRSMRPLFSGGHDSICATFIASQHPLFSGEVFHIDTGIGARATRAFVDEVCEEYGWTLRVLKSNATFERFVTRLGFPGPGSHQWVYNWLKDRCVSQMMKGAQTGVMLVTGCREQESTRRMGSVKPVKVGELGKNGKVRRKKRIWTAPCFDWSDSEQRAFMGHFRLPINPVKDSPLGMSGECFCGAFARPNEIALIRRYAPDVAEEIDRLTILAETAGTHARWGERPDRRRGLVRAKTGPLCTSCDRRAAAAGLLFEDLA